jgi:hypothetical protein
MKTPGTPQPIRTPAPGFASASVIADYQRWLAGSSGLRCDSYDALWREVGEGGRRQ